MRSKELRRAAAQDLRQHWRFGLASVVPAGATAFALGSFDQAAIGDQTPILIALGLAVTLWIALAVLAAIAWHRRILTKPTPTWRATLRHPPLLRYALGCLPVAAMAMTILGIGNASIQHLVFLHLRGTSTLSQTAFTLYLLLAPIAAPLSASWLWCVFGAGLPAISLRNTAALPQRFWPLMIRGISQIRRITGAYLWFAIPMGLLGILLDRWQSILIYTYQSKTALLWVSDALLFLWSLAMTLITIALVTRIYASLTAQAR